MDQWCHMVAYLSHKALLNKIPTPQLCLHYRGFPKKYSDIKESDNDPTIIQPGV